MGTIKNKVRSNIRGRWSILKVSTGVFINIARLRHFGGKGDIRRGARRVGSKLGDLGTLPT